MSHLELLTLTLLKTDLINREAHTIVPILTSVCCNNKTISNIIIGQNIVSKKANAGKLAQASPFTVSLNRPLQKMKSKCTAPVSKSHNTDNIKVIRL